MRIAKATRRYEQWLSEYLPRVEPDLALKHIWMAEDRFSFLSATFYRWAQLFPEHCPELAQAPQVLAIGDLHVENFGTWRDREGRLIWGINDFDEASPLPYTNDLVRLAVSAHLALVENRLQLAGSDACEAIMRGYREGLDARGKPFVLAEEHGWLRAIALTDLRDPLHFWSKMNSLPSSDATVSRGAVKMLARMLPEPDLNYRIVHRTAGLGSLGRERWVAIAEWRGGRLAREVKPLAPSAWSWAQAGTDEQIYYEEIVDCAVRCPDPCLEVRRRWVGRRLAPDCSTVELADLPREREESQLLHAMGWETANVHLGTPQAARAVRRDLQNRPADWLHAAAKSMAQAITTDWEAWKHDMKTSTENSEVNGN